MDIKEKLELITSLEERARAHTGKALSESAQARTCDNKIQEIKKEILTFLQENGCTKDTIDMGIVNFVVSVVEGRESVDCPDIEAVPEPFICIKKEVDKKAVGEYLKNHTPNWASFKRGEPYLVIKSELK